MTLTQYHCIPVIWCSNYHKESIIKGIRSPKTGNRGSKSGIKEVLGVTFIRKYFGVSIIVSLFLNCASIEMNDMSTMTHCLL